MSTFRIEKNKNYTVMSNYHLQDMNLSLKAIGLLSKMLSLPDNWDYSQAGLAAICKDGEDAIRSALKELEKNGYLVRERTRDENGRMGGMLYHVYEAPKHLFQENNNVEVPKPQPQKKKTSKKSPKQETPQVGSPIWENPVMVNPTLDNSSQEIPIQEQPTSEEQAQLNTNNTQNTKLLNTNPSIYQSREDRTIDGLSERNNDLEEYEAYQEMIKYNISYDFFATKAQKLENQFEIGEISLNIYERMSIENNMKLLDKIIDYMTDVMVSKSTEPIKVGQDLVSREIVKSKIMKMNMVKMRKLIIRMAEEDIKNPKSYAISMIYNM